ncbi:MAG TPA: DUF2249 domain-containing protein [Verrucomicrobiae bacterium]|nr:DUF2249 domain-containing protein [Verrucomicrobiae bacterium]
MSKSTITLDVRDDIRNGREPFAKIAATVARLAPTQNLLLIAPFEPVPLYYVLAKQGFSHESQQNAGGDWEVLFSRDREKPAAVEDLPGATPCGCSRSETKAAPVLELDARGLEPPQPMVNILEALSALPAGAQLRAHTDRRPVHLYPMLEERGFTAQTEEQSDGSFITNIRQR